MLPRQRPLLNVALVRDTMEGLRFQVAGQVNIIVQSTSVVLKLT